MIEWLKTWANQIIVATIMAIILEMILPEGNNKKYIKMIIGIYVLFIIINPIISKVTGGNWGIGNFDYSQYFDDTIEIYSNLNEFEDNNSKLITKAYIDNIENDIKTKIQQKGYKVSGCKINIIEDENSEKYGTIINITLQLNRIEEKSVEGSNNIHIENVEVNINSNKNSQEEIEEEKNEIKDKEIIALKEYLSTEYSIDRDFININ